MVFLYICISKQGLTSIFLITSCLQLSLLTLVQQGSKVSTFGYSNYFHFTKILEPECETEAYPRFLRRWMSEAGGPSKCVRPALHLSQNMRNQKVYGGVFCPIFFAFRAPFFHISRPFFRFSHFAAFRAWVGIHAKSQRISRFIFSRH